MFVLWLPSYLSKRKWGKSMKERLSGQAVFFDDGQSVLLGGRLVLSSDGVSRSEIVLRDFDGQREERLVFSQGATWIPVHQLIQVVRETYDVSAVVPNAGPEVPVCIACSGAGGNEDDEGNWQDCEVCSG